MRAPLIVGIGLCFLAALPAHARQPGAPESVESRSAEPRSARFPLLRDAATSASPGSQFRQAMLEDLRKNVPLFYEKMQALRSLQQERQKLQIQKREAAQSPEGSAVKLHRFHELLRREDAMTSRQKALLSVTAGDVETIRAQIALRRTQIEVTLADLEQTPHEPVPQTSNATTSDTRFLSRALRVYEFLDQRLVTLQKNPRQTDWMRPLMKGMFIVSDDNEGSRRERDEQRLRHLRGEQEDLRRRMQRIQREIDDLSDQLRDERKPGPRMRSRPDRQSPSPEPLPAAPSPEKEASPVPRS